MPSQAPFFLQCLKRLADQGVPSGGSTVLIALRAYPAILLLYGAGIACLAHGNNSFLVEMFRLNVRMGWDRDEVPVTRALSAMTVMQRRGYLGTRTKSRH
jgi:hypothetical protein